MLTYWALVWIQALHQSYSSKCWIETSKVLGIRGFSSGPPSHHHHIVNFHELWKLLHFHHMIKVLSVQICCAVIMLSASNGNVSRSWVRNFRICPSRRGLNFASSVDREWVCAWWLSQSHGWAVGFQVVLAWLLLSCWLRLWLCHWLKLRTHFLVQTVLRCLEETICICRLKSASFCWFCWLFWALPNLTGTVLTCHFASVLSILPGIKHT